MLTASALSVTARRLRGVLAPETGVPEDQILIGHPSLNYKEADSQAGKQFLNLFFYRLEYGAFPADGGPEAPIYMRLFCLITPLGSKEAANGATVSAGENDLRLVGAVVKLFHEHPVLPIADSNNEIVAQLQILFTNLSLDDINHIWSTQGETPYRLSAAYELALLPLPLAEAQQRGPIAGSVGLAVRASKPGAGGPGADGPIAGVAPDIPRVQVDAGRSDWMPHLFFVAADGELRYSLYFPDDRIPAQIQVVGAGKIGEQVDVVWEKWDKASGLWQPAGPPAQLTLTTDRVDPMQPPFAPLARPVAFPMNAEGQAMVYATRRYTRSDGTVVTLRSNPLLVSIYRGGA